MKTKIYFWGGYTNHLYELACSMSSIGYEVIIVLFDDMVKRNERIRQSGACILQKPNFYQTKRGIKPKSGQDSFVQSDL